MRLPTLKQLESLPRQNALGILDSYQREELAGYDDATLWHRRGRGYARKLIREKLKRIENLRRHFGL
jgi:hypothetical protein